MSDTTGPVVDDTFTTPVAVSTAMVITDFVHMDSLVDNSQMMSETVDMVFVMTDMIVTSTPCMFGSVPAMFTEMIQTMEDLEKMMFGTDMIVELQN